MGENAVSRCVFYYSSRFTRKYRTKYSENASSNCSLRNTAPPSPAQSPMGLSMAVSSAVVLTPMASMVLTSASARASASSRVLMKEPNPNLTSRTSALRDSAAFLLRMEAEDASARQNTP